MLRWMGAVDDTTLVVTTIHDCQLLDEPIESSKMLEHDVPVDVIVTPTQVGFANHHLGSWGLGGGGSRRCFSRVNQSAQ